MIRLLDDQVGSPSSRFSSLNHPVIQSYNYPNIGFGLGLRAEHYDEILEVRPREVEWFEIISENFIEAHHGYWDFLADLRQSYPIVMHGVSLNIGSSDKLNKIYLKKLKKLADFLDTPWFSDHLCWTGVNKKNTHDLLPVPYTPQNLAHISDRITQVQDFMQRQFILENPSTYLEFNESTIPEWEFLAEICRKSGCGILLDVNNIYVNSFNHGYNAREYIDAITAESIAQIHLAGHHNFGTHIVDTHDAQVKDDVWDLYSYTIKTKGKISTMIEWDDNIPAFAVLLAEIDKARKLT